MLTLDVQVRDFRYYMRCPRLGAFCRHIIETAWQSQTESEVSLVLADDNFVRELNRIYRDKDTPTNVLSFESGLKPEKGVVWIAGDIIVAYQTVAREAGALGKSFKEHFAHLLIHGALHLQGFDHITLKDAKKMESLEVKLMNDLGYEDPYKDII